MSIGRIDAITTNLFPGGDIFLDVECSEPGVMWLRGDRLQAKLTEEEARYLADELSGALAATPQTEEEE